MLKSDRYKRLQWHELNKKEEEFYKMIETLEKRESIFMKTRFLQI